MYSILSTVLVSLALIAIVAGVVAKIVRDKKQGKRNCGMACSGCPGATMCQGEGAGDGSGSPSSK
jgi:hypothetical protein